MSGPEHDDREEHTEVEHLKQLGLGEGQDDDSYELGEGDPAEYTGT